MKPTLHPEPSSPSPHGLFGALDLATWIAMLARTGRPGRDVMVLVADEPVRSMLWEIAMKNGFDTFACRTPFEVVDTLVELGDRVECAILDSEAPWSGGLAEFLADEYPLVRRVLLVD